ncbi:tyrosine-type recombinase/integrase [Paenibacillus dendritiformis]|uniref:tyrosine-type recombinase/integrase n=2 Tax=Paenibacillus dendritiformis TaxID=130049 RepID=UPI00268A051C
MSQSLTNDLRYHVNWQNQNKLGLNDAYHHDLNLVLCREDGNFMPKSSLFNAFSRILKRAGLPPWPIHSLRHTHAVKLLESGADMKYVQERLGHGSIQITCTPTYPKNLRLRIWTSLRITSKTFSNKIVGVLWVLHSATFPVSFHPQIKNPQKPCGSRDERINIRSYIDRVPTDEPVCGTYPTRFPSVP